MKFVSYLGSRINAGVGLVEYDSLCEGTVSIKWGVWRSSEMFYTWTGINALHD